MWVQTLLLLFEIRFQAFTTHILSKAITLVDDRVSTRLAQGSVTKYSIILRRTQSQAEASQLFAPIKIFVLNQVGKTLANSWFGALVFSRESRQGQS